MRIASVVLAVLAACSVPKPTFECGDWLACGPGGVCEPGTNACSYPDSSCLGGWRFSDLSRSPYADTCVEQPPRAEASEICEQDTDCLDLRKCFGGRCVSVEALSMTSDLGCAECAAQGISFRFPFCWGANSLLPVITPQFTTLNLYNCAVTDGCPTECQGCGDTCPQYCYGTERLSSLSVGDSYLCWDNGRTSCIGENEWSQIGVPATPVGTVAALVTPVRYDLLAAGLRHTCGRDAAMTSKLDCWGATDHGQLGIDQPPSPGSSPTPVRSDPFPPQPNINLIRDIAVADQFTCASSNENTVRCWGAAPGGAGVVSGLGSGAVIALDAGGGHACAVVGGRVMCWGANDHGQAAPSVRAAEVPPTQVLDGQTFVQVVTGRAHSCAVTTIGTTYCWGASELEQLGPGATGPGPVLLDLPYAVGVIDAGEDVTCQITADDLVRCWGKTHDAFPVCGRDLP